MSNSHGTPVILDNLESARPLHRLPLDRPPFTEAQLQEILRCHPDVLPLGDIEPAFAPAICIGREVNTGSSGLIDNLYISPSGHISLIETKLWKNPEARRQAVAQVLDYAKDLTGWTYRDLDAAAGAYQQRQFGKSIPLYA